MLVSITYNEVVDFVKRNFDITISLEQIDSKTLKIGVKLALLLPKISLKLHVEDNSEDSMLVHCDSIAISKIFKMIESYLSDDLSKIVEIDNKNKSIKFNKRLIIQNFSLDISKIEFDVASMKIMATNFCLI